MVDYLGSNVWYLPRGARRHAQYLRIGRTNQIVQSCIPAGKARYSIRSIDIC